MHGAIARRSSPPPRRRSPRAASTRRSRTSRAARASASARVYRHFPTKDALVAALAEEHFERLADTRRGGARGARRRLGDVRGDDLAHRRRPSPPTSPGARSSAAIRPPSRRPSRGQHRLAAVTSTLLARAQASGAMRADVTVADISTIMCGFGHIAAAQRAGAALDWKRYLDDRARRPARSMTWSQRLLAVFFTAAGALHFLRPGCTRRSCPSYVPAHHELVLASGAAEIGGRARRHPAAHAAAGRALAGRHARRGLPGERPHGAAPRPLPRPVARRCCGGGWRCSRWRSGGRWPPRGRARDGLSRSAPKLNDNLIAPLPGIEVPGEQCSAGSRNRRLETPPPSSPAAYASETRRRARNRESRSRYLTRPQTARVVGRRTDAAAPHPALHPR